MPHRKMAAELKEFEKNQTIKRPWTLGEVENPNTLAAEAIARRDAGEALTDIIARTFGVSHTTIGRLTASSPSV
jgi:hypothetical protein